ncbi:hypothetical protein K469DRAFT_687250 [Zopfia rhizophila CBS 207.26]|uniref:Uncharacterized protein n=1 Tax=Zopfia rhizophila CBS 207.26 TaxID=1314779 RepID=A0A6A6E6P8_9PEZI|nr:hypothetical protein K469DRAFT_687250 [Zopfia rhizophila CBS 207.26]
MGWRINIKKSEHLKWRTSETDLARSITATDRGSATEISHSEEKRTEKSQPGEMVKLDQGEMEGGKHADTLNFSRGPDGITATKEQDQTTQTLLNWLSRTIENSPPTSDLQPISEIPDLDDSISIKTQRHDDYSLAAKSCDSRWWSEDPSDETDVVVPSALNPIVKRPGYGIVLAFAEVCGEVSFVEEKWG